MLCLKVPSQQSWIDAAGSDLDRVLLDHAHCEKKAAVNAMALVSRYPGCDTLVREMIALAKEEMEHFGMVYDIIRERGGVLGRDPGDPYVQALHREARMNEPARMLDLLLIGALIEARSCERFSMLSKHVPDLDLRSFYASLLASEAGHYRTFYDIACEYYPEAEVRARLDALATREAEIVLGLASEPTMHG
jgi:tRNA-(ms[2]io[6]A)-hydroxylase